MIKKNLIKIHDNDVDRIMSNHNSYLQIHDLMNRSLASWVIYCHLWIIKSFTSFKPPFYVIKSSIIYVLYRCTPQDDFAWMIVEA